MFEYNYTIQNFHFDLLDKSIRQNFNSFDGVARTGTEFKFLFSVELSEVQEQQLQELIENHEQSYSQSFDYTDYTMEMAKNTQQQNIEFGQQLLQDWMRKNSLEGMTIDQSLWVFSRFEALYLDLPWGNSRIDLFKLFQAGALPTLYYCLFKITPDDMTESYHWITSERIDWVKERVANHIGAGMTAYIQQIANQ